GGGQAIATFLRTAMTRFTKPLLPQRLLPRRLELVTRIPRRKGGIVGDRKGGEEAEAGVFDGAVVVPVGIEIVARLVIVVGHVVLGLLFAPAGGLADEIGAGFEKE